MGNVKLAAQATYYVYDVYDSQPLGTYKLVQFGAFANGLAGIIFQDTVPGPAAPAL